MGYKIKYFLKKFLFFQELLIAYFQDKNTLLLEGKLVAQLDDGTSVPIELEGQGTFTECGKLYQFFNSIHPSIAYIINEGVDLKGRSLGWSQAWSGFKERPILGWGPENFDLVFFKYLKGTDYQGYPPAKLDRAHSRPLDVLVTTGILGFILWGALWILIFFSIIKNILKNDKNLVIYLIVFSSLTTYFVSSLFLFPQATWYVQFFILIGVVSRSDDGFLSTVDLREVVIKKKRKRSSDEANMGNVIVTLVSVLIGIIVFYWLIIIPYYVSSNTLPISNSKNLDELEEIAARFEPLASYGRSAILNQALEDWEQIVDLPLGDQQEVLKTLEEIGLKSLIVDPENYFINQRLFLFYYNLSNTNDTFLISADKYAKKLINLSPEHINSHESMIRFYLAKQDYQESKKWVDKWKSVHPDISILDRDKWDNYIEELKYQIE